MSNNSKIIDQTLVKLGFHGSYRPEDVTFLMQVDDIQPTDVEEKEYLIQSGKMHYSQMISVENPPTEEHMKHFHHAFEQGALRLAEEVQKIGNSLLQRFPQQPIVLISLVRAGVPLGVLFKHYLSTRHLVSQNATDQNLNIQNHDVHHYGISIIRDRGIDFAALQAIIEQHGAENI
ncbi:MAG: tellurite-like stress resistance cysteine protease StiP, partial [Acinetobacter sp.]